MEVVLETERLILRRFTDADVDALVDLDSDPQVTRFITGGEPEFDRDMLDAWLAQYDRWPAYGTFAAIERSGGDDSSAGSTCDRRTATTTSRSWAIGSSAKPGARALRPRGRAA